MTKLLPVTTELENCSECIFILDWFDTGLRENRCEKSPRGKGYRIIKDSRGEFPKFCPLEEKK